MVLINVDLPAPLSPSRQCTSPSLTATLTPERAMIIPKCFSMFLSSRTGVVMSAFPGDDAANVGVEDDGNEQDEPEEHAEQRTLDTREEETLLNDAKDDRAERCAKHGAVAAGQEGSANDDGDYRFEFLEQSSVRSSGSKLKHLAGREHSRA